VDRAGQEDARLGHGRRRSGGGRGAGGRRRGGGRDCGRGAERVKRRVAVRGPDGPSVRGNGDVVARGAQVRRERREVLVELAHELGDLLNPLVAVGLGAGADHVNAVADVHGEVVGELGRVSRVCLLTLADADLVDGDGVDRLLVISRLVVGEVVLGEREPPLLPALDAAALLAHEALLDNGRRRACRGLRLGRPDGALVAHVAQKIHFRPRSPRRARQPKPYAAVSATTDDANRRRRSLAWESAVRRAGPAGFVTKAPIPAALAMALRWTAFANPLPAGATRGLPGVSPDNAVKTRFPGLSTVLGWAGWRCRATSGFHVLVRTKRRRPAGNKTTLDLAPYDAAHHIPRHRPHCWAHGSTG